MPRGGSRLGAARKKGALTNIKGFQGANPDLTLTINRADLEQTMMGAKTLDAQIADGTAQAVGDVGILKRLAAIMVDFDPRFEIMPGTKARTPGAGHSPPLSCFSPGGLIGLITGGKKRK